MNIFFLEDQGGDGIGGGVGQRRRDLVRRELERHHHCLGGRRGGLGLRSRNRSRTRPP